MVRNNTCKCMPTLCKKMHMDSCMRAYSTVQQLLCHGGYCELILSLARTSCRLLFTARPTACSLAALRDVVRSRNPSESTLAHDAVATAVLHKHHPIIRDGAGLIQFVFRSHLRLATEATRNRNAFSPFFPRVKEVLQYTRSQSLLVNRDATALSYALWRVLSNQVIWVLGHCWVDSANINTFEGNSILSKCVVCSPLSRSRGSRRRALGGQNSPNKLFWNWNHVVRFVSQEVWFAKLTKGLFYLTLS